MADVASSLFSWSTNEASNAPAGSTTVGTGWDDNLRMIQKVIRGALATKGADIASAGTTDIGAVEGLFHDITGTTSITALGTVSAGIWKVLKFEGILTLTHNATSLIIPGAANITTADGDMCMVTSEGSGNWRVNWYVRANGSPIAPFIDTNPIVVGSSDATKKLRFEVDGFTAGNTRVITPPDADLTIPAVTAKGDILSASASGVLAKTAVGTNGKVLTADSTAGGGVAWSAPSAKNLASGSVTAAATLDITQFDSSLYTNYKIVLYKVAPANDAVGLYLRTSTDGGGSFATSGYAWAGNVVTSAPSTSGTGATSAGQIQVSVDQALGNGAGEMGDVVIYITGMHDSGTRTEVHFSYSMVDATPVFMSIKGSGQRQTAEDNNAVRLLMSAGNIATMKWILYGYT